MQHTEPDSRTHSPSHLRPNCQAHDRRTLCKANSFAYICADSIANVEPDDQPHAPPDATKTQAVLHHWLL